jgi:Flp pilus assembly protein TadG
MSMTRRARRKHDDRGSVTVEAAIALAAFVIFLGAALGSLSAAADQVRCVDAAREAARLVARGEADQAADVVARIAPTGAEITIDTEGEHIHVGVQATPVGGMLPGLHIHADAFAVREPDG